MIKSTIQFLLILAVMLGIALTAFTTFPINSGSTQYTYMNTSAIANLTDAKNYTETQLNNTFYDLNLTLSTAFGTNTGALASSSDPISVIALGFGALAALTLKTMLNVLFLPLFVINLVAMYSNVLNILMQAYLPAEIYMLMQPVIGGFSAAVPVIIGLTVLFWVIEFVIGRRLE